MLDLRKLNFKRAVELSQSELSTYRLGVLFFSPVCSDWRRQWSPTDWGSNPPLFVVLLLVLAVTS